MSTDPYHLLQSEIQSSLQTASTLRASFVRIRSMSGSRGGGESEELVWARNELKATLAAFEADLEDLEESVKIVESTDARLFGIDEEEVTKRRRYVLWVRSEVQSMRDEINGSATPSASTPISRTPVGGGWSRQDGEEEDHQGAWAREEQQMIIREQDTTLDSIAGTLTTLAQQAGLMGREIGEHNELLDDLERGVDHTDNKLSGAMRRMKKLIRETEETKSGWCIVILIIVLIALLLAVILV